MASQKASWSEFTVFSKKDKLGFSRTRVHLLCYSQNSFTSLAAHLILKFYIYIDSFKIAFLAGIYSVYFRALSHTGYNLVTIQTLFTTDKPGSKSIKAVFSIAICRQSGHKWQSNTNHFWSVFVDSINVLIATYPMCFMRRGNQEEITDFLRN